MSTLLGLDEQPGDLDGYGPIPADLARRLAADPTGTWRRLLTDAHGRLLDYGRTTYRPPADLRDYVIARDRTCTHPVCHRDARRCDLDHLLDWAHGGSTEPENLGPKCPRHHTLKHDGGWHTERLPDGTTRWTTPSGRTYDSPPATYPVDTTTAGEPPRTKTQMRTKTRIRIRIRSDLPEHLPSPSGRRRPSRNSRGHQQLEQVPVDEVAVLVLEQRARAQVAHDAERSGELPERVTPTGLREG